MIHALVVSGTVTELAARQRVIRRIARSCCANCGMKFSPDIYKGSAKAPDTQDCQKCHAKLLALDPICIYCKRDAYAPPERFDEEIISCGPKRAHRTCMYRSGIPLAHHALRLLLAAMVRLPVVVRMERGIAAIKPFNGLQRYANALADEHGRPPASARSQEACYHHFCAQLRKIIEAIGVLDIGRGFVEMQVGFMLEICYLSKQCLLYDLEVKRFPVRRERHAARREAVRIGLSMPFIIRGTTPQLVH
jgi:hypothetical protein